MADIQVKVSGLKLNELESFVEKTHEHINYDSLQVIKSGAQFSPNKFLTEQGNYTYIVPGEEFNPFMESTENRLLDLELNLTEEKELREQEIASVNTRIDNIEQETGVSPDNVTHQELENALTDNLTEAKAYTDVKIQELGVNNLTGLELLNYLPSFDLRNFKNTSLCVDTLFYNKPILNYFGSKILSDIPELDFSCVDIFNDTVIVNWALIKQRENELPSLISIPSAILSLSGDSLNYLLKSTVRKEENYFDFVFDNNTKKIDSSAFIVVYDDESISKNTKYYLSIISIKVLKGRVE